MDQMPAGYEELYILWGCQQCLKWTLIILRLLYLKWYIKHMHLEVFLQLIAPISLLQSAPEYWLNLDPSWKGSGPPMRRYFHPDGSQTADPTDQVWGGHESQFSIVTSYVGNGEIREHYVRINRWPPMTVIRKEDWSWELFNQLYHYNSIPDANKEGGTGPCFPVW